MQDKIINITCGAENFIEIDKIKDLQGNLKDKTRLQLDKLKRQILKHGFSFPLFIWKNNNDIYSVDGHGRRQVVEELIKDGYLFKRDGGKPSTKIPVDFIDAKDKKEAKEKLLALNSSFGRITEEGFYEYLNEPGFELDFDSLKMDLELPNIDLEKFEIGWMKDVDEDKLDDVPEVQKEAISKLGDLFLLDGKHRILCGDSTKREDVEKLMDGKKADLVLTDPPYGMSLDTDYSKTHSTKSKKYDKVIGDNKDFTPELIKIIFDCFNCCSEIFIWGADYFIDLIPNYGKDGSWLVWDKKSSEKKFELHVDSDFQKKVRGNSFELCWSKAKHKRLVYHCFWIGSIGEGKYENRTASQTVIRSHPTQKPILLFMNILKDFGKEDDLVADLFLGSGSTLIACAQTNRICFALEIESLYIDVALRRYHNLYPDKEIKCLNRKSFSFEMLFND